jgi:predicted GIY-YIG superfamily endonuclease
MRNRPIGAPKKNADCNWSIACECGRSYTGETGRPWAMRIRKHLRNLEVGHLERSRLAQHLFEESHLVLWEEAIILETEKNPVYRKNKEAVYMACLQNPI